MEGFLIGIGCFTLGYMMAAVVGALILITADSWAVPIP